MSKQTIGLAVSALLLNQPTFAAGSAPPAWEQRCAVLMAANLPCTKAFLEAGGSYKPPKPANPAVTIPAYTAPNWGVTYAQMQANLPAGIMDAFHTSPVIDSQITNIQWIMLARLSTELARLDTGNTYRPNIFIYAAQRLSAANLATMRSAFGSAMDIYIVDYAPAAVLAAYRAIKPYPVLYLSHAYYLSKGLPDEVSITTRAPYDVFLQAYFGTRDTPIMALKRATSYMQSRTKATVWEWIFRGQAVWDLLDKLDPQWQQQLEQLGQDMKATTQMSPITWPPPFTPEQGPPADVLPSVIPVDSPPGLPDPSEIYFPPFDYDPDNFFDICDGEAMAFC